MKVVGMLEHRGELLLTMIDLMHQMIDEGSQFQVKWDVEHETAIIQDAPSFDRHFGVLAARDLVAKIEDRLKQGEPPSVRTAGEAMLELVNERGLSDA